MSNMWSVHYFLSYSSIKIREKVFWKQCDKWRCKFGRVAFWKTCTDRRLLLRTGFVFDRGYFAACDYAIHSAVCVKSWPVLADRFQRPSELARCLPPSKCGKFVCDVPHSARAILRLISISARVSCSLEPEITLPSKYSSRASKQSDNDDPVFVDCAPNPFRWTRLCASDKTGKINWSTVV